MTNTGTTVLPSGEFIFEIEYVDPTRQILASYIESPTLYKHARNIPKSGLANEKWDSKRGDRRWIDLMIDNAIRYARRKK